MQISGFALPAHVLYVSVAVFIRYCSNDAMNPVLPKSQWFTIICVDLLEAGCSGSMPGRPHGQVLICTPWRSFKSFLWWRSSNISTLRSCQSEDGKRADGHFHWPLKMPLERDLPLPSLPFHGQCITWTNPSLTRWECTLPQGQVGKGE